MSTGRPQLNTTSVLYGFYLAANGDEASTKGIELEIEGNLADSFHYRAGYTYVDAQLEKDFISPQTGGIVAHRRVRRCRARRRTS